MLTTILESILAALKSIPYFDKWFSKTPTEKIEDAKETARKESDEFRKTGRPQ